MATPGSTFQERIQLRGDAAPPANVTPAELLLSLQRRLVLAVALFILLGSAAGGLFYAWYTYLPTYEAAGLIQLVSNVPKEELTVAEGGMNDRALERFALSQSYRVKSPEVLAGVLADAQVKATSWYKSKPNDQARLLGLMKELVSAPVRGTDFLRISISTRNPDDPEPIVNAVMRTYLENETKIAADQYQIPRINAVEERNRVENRLKGLQQDRLRQADLLPGGVTAGLQSPASDQVRIYAEQVAQLDLDVAQLREFAAFYASGESFTMEDRQSVEADPYVLNLRNHLFQFEQQKTTALKSFGVNHPTVAQLDQAIEATQEQLAKRQGEVLEIRVTAMRELAATAMSSTVVALTSARENLLKAQIELKDFDRKVMDFQYLERQILGVEERKKELDGYIEDLDRLIETRTGVNIRIAQVATDPLQRSTPQLILLPALIALCLLLSAGGAVLIDLLDRSVRTGQDLFRCLQLGLLGVVPDADDEEVEIRSIERASLDQPRTLVAEAFRQIRANLHFAAPASQQRIILVTSPGAEDGKTTLAVNLATAAAMAGRRILLVDANLRRPRLRSIFKATVETGLSNLLIEEGSLESAIVKTPLERLHVLCSGPSSPNPADLLSGELFQKFIEQAASRYDQVILDGPPVLISSDASLIAAAVDGVIMAVRARLHPRGAARRACVILDSVGARLIGAVLNAAAVTRGGYFREQLHAFYEYQKEPRAGR